MSQFYEEVIQNGSLAQANQLAYWQPTPGVPAFDKEKAAGKPGIWNFIQPTAMKGNMDKHLPQGLRKERRTSRKLWISSGCARTKMADPVSYTHLRAHETLSDL
eukprot:7371697-Karenia_brevis.AAC.1